MWGRKEGKRKEREKGEGEGRGEETHIFQNSKRPDISDLRRKNFVSDPIPLFRPNSEIYGNFGRDGIFSVK
jgi:hypothetical protein